LRLRLETSSVRHEERLSLDFLDYATARWEPATLLHQEALGDGWEALTFDVCIPAIDNARYRDALEKADEESRLTVEIVAVRVVRNGDVIYAVAEREPFEIRVDIRVNRSASVLDVGIKIVRSDGVYVFWQSSGLDGANLRDAKGDITVCFRFE